MDDQTLEPLWFLSIVILILALPGSAEALQTKFTVVLKGR